MEGKERRRSVAATRAFRTSPTTSNSATIGVPATTSAQISQSSRIGGSSTTVNNTGNTLAMYIPTAVLIKQRRELADFLKENLEAFRNLDSPPTLDEAAREEVDEIVTALDLYLETVKKRRQTVANILRGVEELLGIANKDGLLPDDNKFFSSMRKEAAIFEREWNLMTVQINKVVSIVKDAQPGGIDEFLQLKDTVGQMLDKQLTKLFSLQQMIDELRFHVK